MKEAALNRIKGFLRAFAAINSKDNQEYYFEVELLPSFSTIQDVIAYWDKFAASLFEEKNTWQAVLKKYLNSWLFNFQFYYPSKRNSFSLSLDIYKETLLEEVIEDFYRLGDFEKCYTVRFGCDNPPHDDVASDNILLLAKDCSVLVHFGVSA